MDKSVNIEDQTKQSLIWYTILPMFLQFIRVANTIILARLLMPHDFGIMGIVTVFTYYANTVSGFGIGNAIVQRGQILKSHYDSYFVFNVVVSVILYAIFYLAAPSIAEFFGEADLLDAFRVVAAIFLITAFCSVQQVELQRHIGFKALAQIEALKVAVSMSTSLYFALNGAGYWSLVWALLASNAAMAVALRLAASNVPSFNYIHQNFKELIGYGKWSFFSAQINMLADNADKLVIGKALGTEALGFYDKALGFAKMPFDQLSRRLSSVGFSSYSRAQEDKDRLITLSSKILVVNAFVCFPIFVGLASVSENFTKVVLGDVWIPMIPSLVILSYSFLVAGVAGALFSLNMATGMIKPQSLIRFALIICLVIGMVFYAEQGIEAVALCLLAFNGISLVASFILVNRHLGFTFTQLCSCLFPATFASGVMFAAIFIIDQQTQLYAEWQQFLISIFIGVIAYSLCFLLIPFKRWEFLRAEVRQRLAGLLKKVA